MSTTPMHARHLSFLLSIEEKEEEEGALGRRRPVVAGYLVL